MMHSAVERRLEILGEAAGKISDAFQSSHPEIPWKEIKGIRLVLAHRYGDINLHELWQSVKKDLPDLIPKLDELMPSVGDDDK
jgi:uncharacterized protein with HEPN domain